MLKISEPSKYRIKTKLPLTHAFNCGKTDYIDMKLCLSQENTNKQTNIWLRLIYFDSNEKKKKQRIILRHLILQLWVILFLCSNEHANIRIEEFKLQQCWKHLKLLRAAKLFVVYETNVIVVVIFLFIETDSVFSRLKLIQ